MGLETGDVISRDCQVTGDLCLFDSDGNVIDGVCIVNKSGNLSAATIDGTKLVERVIVDGEAIGKCPAVSPVVEPNPEDCYRLDGVLYSRQPDGLYKDSFGNTATESDLQSAGATVDSDCVACDPQTILDFQNSSTPTSSNTHALDFGAACGWQIGGPNFSAVDGDTDSPSGIDYLKLSGSGSDPRTYSIKYKACQENAKFCFYDIDSTAQESMILSFCKGGVVIPWDESWVSSIGSRLVSDTSGGFTATSNVPGADNFSVRPDNSVCFNMPVPYDEIKVETDIANSAGGRNFAIGEIESCPTGETAKRCYRDCSFTAGTNAGNFQRFQWTGNDSQINENVNSLTPLNLDTTDSFGLPWRSGSAATSLDAGNNQGRMDDVTHSNAVNEVLVHDSYLAIPPAECIDADNPPAQIQARVRKAGRAYMETFKADSWDESTATSQGSDDAAAPHTVVVATMTIPLTDTAITECFVRNYSVDGGVGSTAANVTSWLEFSLDGGNTWDDQPDWFYPTKADAQSAQAPVETWTCDGGTCTSDLAGTAVEAQMTGVAVPCE